MLFTPLQDIVAPFFLFIQSRYSMRYSGIQSNISDQPVFLSSSIYMGVLGIKLRSIKFEMEIKSGRIFSLTATDRLKTIEIKFEPIGYL